MKKQKAYFSFIVFCILALVFCSNILVAENDTDIQRKEKIELISRKFLKRDLLNEGDLLIYVDVINKSMEKDKLTHSELKLLGHYSVWHGELLISKLQLFKKLVSIKKHAKEKKLEAILNKIKQHDKLTSADKIECLKIMPKASMSENLTNVEIELFGNWSIWIGDMLFDRIWKEIGAERAVKTAFQETLGLDTIEISQFKSKAYKLTPSDMRLFAEERLMWAGSILIVLGCGTFDLSHNEDEIKNEPMDNLLSQEKLDGISKRSREKNFLFSKEVIKQLNFVAIEKSVNSKELKLPDNWIQIKTIYYISKMIPIAEKMSKLNPEKDEDYYLYSELEDQYDKIKEYLLAVGKESIPHIQAFFKNTNPYVQEVTLGCLLEWWHKGEYEKDNPSLFLEIITDSKSDKAKIYAFELLPGGYKGVGKWKKSEIERFLKTVKNQKSSKVIVAGLDSIKDYLLQDFFSKKQRQGDIQPFVTKVVLESQDKKIKIAGLGVISVLALHREFEIEKSDLLKIMDLLPDKNKKIRVAVASALVNLVGRKALETINPKIIKRLIDALYDSDWEASQSITRCLANLTGNNFGEMGRNVSNKKKNKIIKQWGKWWEENKDKYLEDDKKK